ncbi:hypothetical protein M8J75_007727 [Diaphorina citri]|nr:hypothetical protein M8J75_007727 [Diaphorina citri]
MLIKEKLETNFLRAALVHGRNPGQEETKRPEKTAKETEKNLSPKEKNVKEIRETNSLLGKSEENITKDRRPTNVTDKIDSSADHEYCEKRMLVN